MTGLSIDHASIVVPDLEEFTLDFSGLGFASPHYYLAVEKDVKVLVLPFVDGSSLYVYSANSFRYWTLFLLDKLGLFDATIGKLSPSGQRIMTNVIRHQGLVDWCFRVDSFNDLMAKFIESGYVCPEVSPINWQRTDGFQLCSQTMDLKGVSEKMPLIITDKTPLSMRVPAPEYCYHSNGVRGIKSLIVPVHNLRESCALWKILTGTEGDVSSYESDNAHIFHINRMSVVLVEPSLGSDLYEWLMQNGERPFEIVLWVRFGLKSRSFPMTMSHGARIRLEPILTDEEDDVPWDEDEQLADLLPMISSDKTFIGYEVMDSQNKMNFNIPTFL